MTTTLSATRIRADVADALFMGTDEIAADDDLLDLGLDSVRIMELVDRWRKTGAEVGFADLAEKPTLRSWTTLLVCDDGPDA